MPLRQQIKLVVCDDCQRALFVNGHPRNFCGHSGRGTLTEFVPADEYRQLRQAAIEFESDLSEYCDGPARDRLRELLHGEKST